MSKTDKLLELVEKNSKLVRVADRRKKEIKELKRGIEYTESHVERLMQVSLNLCEIALEAIAVTAGQKDALSRPPEEAAAAVANLRSMLRMDCQVTFGKSPELLGSDNEAISPEHVEKLQEAMKILYPTPEDAQEIAAGNVEVNGHQAFAPLTGSLNHTEDANSLVDAVMDSLTAVATKIRKFKDQGYGLADLEVLLPVSFGLDKDDHMHIFGVDAVTNADTESVSVVLRTTAEERSE